WPTGLFAREHGLGYQAAQLADVPGHPFTLPTLLAASGVRYLASGVNPERAAPLLSPADAARAQLAGGDWTTYPQLYWWEGPDGSRVLHWRAGQYADGPRFGFDVDPAEMGRRLSDWLLTHPVFLSPAYPYDVALLSGATGDNALLDERVVANVEEFSRRFSYPRLVAARPEDFFREVERRWGAKLPVRRGDTGCYREDGAASTAPRSSRPGPRSCSRCGTRRPSRRVAARPNASSNGPRRAGECGGICCCSASTRGDRRPADRTPTARTPSRSGSTSGGSWTARRPRPTPRSRPRCCGSASALAGAGARAASYSTLRAGRGATWGECRTARRGGSSTRVENGPRWISPTAPRWWWRETSPRWATWRSRK